ncbi:MAG: hypothetical protein R2718_13040 [Solirubrobacterales bacterium]|nr:hypothetical protein [Solirubrobacterales bacterium]
MIDQDPQESPGPPIAPVRWTQASWPAPSGGLQATIDQMTDLMQPVLAAAERVAEAIRQDAERQARLYLVEAQQRADRLTAERVGTISEMTDQLIRQTASVRDQSDRMVRVLEGTIGRLSDQIEGGDLSQRIDSEQAGAQRAQGSATPAAPVERRDAATEPCESYAGTVTRPAPSKSEPVGMQPQSGNTSDRLRAGQAVPVGTDEPRHSRLNGDPHWRSDAVDHARRLAIAGSDRATIASVLRQLWGVADPEPIISRVLDSR